MKSHAIFHCSRAVSALCLLAVFLVTPFALQAQGSDRPEAAPSDVASPEAIVNAAYESLLRSPGENFDWDRFRSLFLPEAILLPNTEQTGGTPQVHSPEEFIAVVNASYAEHAPIGSEKDKGFSEEAIHNEVRRYGDIAQVFSSYKKRFWTEDRIRGRGINSYQLVYRDGRWWIASIAWDEEVGAGPLPEKYLK